jgi:hypothetical protein
MQDDPVIGFINNVLGFGQNLVGRRMRGVLLSLVGFFGWKAIPTWATRSAENQSDFLFWNSLLALAFIWWVLVVIWPENIVRNGKFREGKKHWGTGYLEDELRDGTPKHTDDVRRLPYRAYPSRKETHSDGNPDPHMARRSRLPFWRKSMSFHLDHRSARQPGHWGSVAQRIYGLRPSTSYIVTFRHKGRAPRPKAFFVTGSLTWEPHREIKPSEDWSRQKFEFYSDALVDYAEIRFYMEDEGEFWITDVSIKVPFWRRAF